MHTQNPEKFVVVVPEAFSPKPMNEVQKRLQAVLDYWGPDGERWAVGAGWGDTGGCAIHALGQTSGGLRLGTESKRCAESFMDQAAQEMGFARTTRKGELRPTARCSDSGFSNARKMVLRAIELAE